LRTLLLLLAAVCAFCALVSNTTWGWVGIDQNPEHYRSWLAASALFFSLSFLPWQDWTRRFDK
jgi:hypothetical protein